MVLIGQFTDPGALHKGLVEVDDPSFLFYVKQFVKYRQPAKSVFLEKRTMGESQEIVPGTTP
jgi:hypothetical protein